MPVRFSTWASRVALPFVHMVVVCVHNGHGVHNGHVRWHLPAVRFCPCDTIATADVSLVSPQVHGFHSQQPVENCHCSPLPVHIALSAAVSSLRRVCAPVRAAHVHGAPADRNIRHLSSFEQLHSLYVSYSCAILGKTLRPQGRPECRTGHLKSRSAHGPSTHHSARMHTRDTPTPHPLTVLAGSTCLHTHAHGRGPPAMAPQPHCTNSSATQLTPIHICNHHGGRYSVLEKCTHAHVRICACSQHLLPPSHEHMRTPNSCSSTYGVYVQPS